MLVGSPRKKPELLIKRLGELFTNISSVKVAYIAQVFNPVTKEPPHLTLGLIIDEDLDNVFYVIDNVIKETIAKDEFVDVIDIKKNHIEDIYSKLEPFYIVD